MKFTIVGRDAALTRLKCFHHLQRDFLFLSAALCESGLCAEMQLNVYSSICPIWPFTALF